MADGAGTLEGLGMNLEFWPEKRVFLTGHTGFKGGWLSLWLQHLGAQVTGYALAPATRPNLFEVAKVGHGMDSVIGDIRTFDCLLDAMRAARPEIVIHMAAQPLVRYSYREPIETYATNVMGTVNVLEAVRQTPGIKAVVTVTSDKCYENKEWVWGYRESDPMGGYDPYSNSKGCAELVSSAFRNSYFNPGRYAEHGVALASARAGNVIGGGDWAEDRLIPDVMRAIATGTEVVIRSPQAIRPWQHVLEPLGGYLKLAEALYCHGPAYAEAWNFGPLDHDAKPVAWVVETLAEIWGDGASFRIDQTVADVHEAHYLKLDCSKAHMQLNWQPRWTLHAALEQICCWHKGVNEGKDMRAVTLSQIDAYQSELPIN